MLARLLTSSELPALASHSVVITGMSHHTQPLFNFILSIYFFETESHSVAQAASNSWTQVIFSSQLPKWLGLQAYATTLS